MNDALFLGILSFGLCFIFTPVCRTVAIRLGLVDKPDGGRKRHGRPIPRVGGFAIVAAYAAALALFVALQPPEERLHIQHYALLRVLLPPAALVFLVGLLDDLFTLSALQKLAGQVIACTAASVLGRMYAPESFSFLGPLHSHEWIGVLLCAGWLVLCTNAINLIDGLDGLASGVGLLGASATLLFGLYTHNIGLSIATTPLVGALLAFLCYNFNPASIFLGDCGSLTIGFVLGAISLTWQRPSGPTLGLFAPFGILALPLLDVALAVSRRYLSSKPLFSPDRRHIHHVLQDRGQKPKTTALILYFACAVAISLSVLASVAPRGYRIFPVVAFIVLLAIVLRYLDYVEFRVLRRVLSSRHMRQQVKEEIYLRELDDALSEVETVNDCWVLIEKVCRGLEFATVEMFFQNLYFDAVLQDDVDERDWWLTLPLGQRGYLRVSRANLVGVNSIVMPALDRLQRGLDKWERTTPVDTPERSVGSLLKSGLPKHTQPEF